jgi:hypothetical protein
MHREAVQAITVEDENGGLDDGVAGERAAGLGASAPICAPFRLGQRGFARMPRRAGGSELGGRSAFGLAWELGISFDRIGLTNGQGIGG